MDKGFYALGFWEGLARARGAIGTMEKINGAHGRAFREGVSKLVAQAREDVETSGPGRATRLAERFEQYGYGNSREKMGHQKLREVGIGLYGAIMALYDCHPANNSPGCSHIVWDRQIAQEAMTRIFDNGLS